MTLRITNFAGLFFAPMAWLINTQLGQILPAADCADRMSVTAVAAFGSAAVAAACAVLSQRSSGAGVSRLSGFVASVSTLTALIFAFALLLQGAASVLLSPCAH